jgi:oligoendopeptidase F
MTTTDITADNVVWDLAPLLPTPDDAGIDEVLAAADAKADELAAYHGRIADLDADGLVAFMRGLAEVHDLIGRVGSFVQLDFSTDTVDPVRGARMQKVDEHSAIIGTKLLFFELEWAELDDDKVESLLADPRLDFASHHLRSARRYRPHLLSEPEEVVLTEKSVTGSSAWQRLFDEQISAISVDLDGETTTLEAGLSLLQTPDREVRKAAAEAVTAGLAPGLRTRSFVLNTLLADKSIDDRMRHFDSWIASRNLSNEASDASVQALVDAVQGRYSIPQRWYTLKATLLGIDRLADYDRMASIGGVESKIGWNEAQSLVLDAYGSFSGELADTARQFFDNAWIDAAARPGKRPGAFCAYTVPTHHPYLLLNWTSRRRDVLTLAHELGHGLHAYLARGQGVFHQTTQLTLAETASLFGETVTFGRLLETVTDPA